jgi:hypothetical protein
VSGVKGRRFGAVTYAPNGTVEGDTPAVDADGLIAWGPPAGGFVPTYIGPGETFTIPVNKQAVFLFPVVNDGDLVISGDFGQVD